jgi:hypothetical protein
MTRIPYLSLGRALLGPSEVIIRSFILCSLFSASSLAQTLQIKSPRLRYTVHVVDEAGNPLPGITFEALLDEDAVNLDKKIRVPQSTDINGDLTIEGYSSDGFPVMAKPLSGRGYYDSGFPLKPFQRIENGRWQPWGTEVTAMMRLIGQPIPLLVRNLNLPIPRTAPSVGLDLEEADWIAPFGRGKTADLMVKLVQLDFKGVMDEKVSAIISFPNPADGIQAVTVSELYRTSRFIWPREAPLTGYQQPVEAHRILIGGGRGPKPDFSFGKDQTHFFRVRTSQAGGTVTSALYGKIKGGVVVGTDRQGNPWFGLSYYLNPTPNDRNLEFSGKNLFANLGRMDYDHSP